MLDILNTDRWSANKLCQKAAHDWSSSVQPASWKQHAIYNTPPPFSNMLLIKSKSNKDVVKHYIRIPSVQMSLYKVHL